MDKNNVGKKVKIFAGISRGVLIFSSILGAIASALYVINSDNNLIGVAIIIFLIVIILGIYNAFFVSTMILAFGQMVEDTGEIKSILQRGNIANDANDDKNNTKLLTDEEVKAQIMQLKKELNAGRITPEKYNHTIDKLKEDYYKSRT